MKILLRSLCRVVIAIWCMLALSCGNQANKSKKAITSNHDSTHSDTATLDVAEHIASNDSIVEVMDADDIRLNGKLKRFFTLEEFHSIMGDPDSTKLLSDEEPCTTNFSEPDGSVDLQARYLYKNGSRFENAKDKVAIDHIRFSDGDFITYKNIILNSRTDIKDLQKLFPVAAKFIGVMDVAGEGKLQVMQLREDKDNVSDGHVNIFLKNGRLYLLEWWFPC